MAITLGSNHAALRLTGSLLRSSDALSRSYERLSSGARINRAADDAAGLTIADNLRTNVRLHTTAIRNVNDGLSATRIATETLKQQGDMLHRMLELAEQSANGSYGATQRLALAAEYRALVHEFGRIGDTTKFNGMNLLWANRAAGSSSLSLQAGTNGSTDSIIAIQGHDSGRFSGVIDTGDFASADWDGSTALGPNDFASFGDWIVSISGTDGFNLIAERFGNALIETTMTDSAGRTREVLVAFNKSHSGGDSLSSVGIMTFVKNLNGTGYSSHASNFTAFQDGGFAIDGNGRLSESNIALSTSIGVLRLDLGGLRFFDSQTSGITHSAIDASGIQTVTRALDALGTLRARLGEIHLGLGTYGAAESRLLTSISVLGSLRENSQSAESRIRDVDIAAESAQLTKLSILQQISASLLAQSGTQYEIGLQLLGRAR